MLIPPGPMIFISTELPNPPGARHRRSQRSCRISIIGNKWIPKVFGLWRVQGEPWPCFLEMTTKRGWSILSNESSSGR
jgi:hypothetical protein